MTLAKSLCLTLCAVALLVGPVSSQNYVGVVGGVNFANLNIDLEPPEDNFDHLAQVSAGTVVGFRFHKNLTLHSEPMYVRKGGKQKDFTLEFGAAEFFYKTDMIEIPLLLKASVQSGRLEPYLLAGPTVGFILDTRLEVLGNGFKFKGDADNISKSIDFGVSVGGGLDFSFSKVSVFVEGRYVHGLSNINEGGVVTLESGTVTEMADIEEVRVKTKGFSILTGITFPW